MVRAASLLVRFTAILAVVTAGRDAPCQQGAWYEGFEGPNTSWQLAGGNARYRIEFHGRIRGEAHTGEGCERIRIWGNDGTEVYLGHDVGRPQLIDELLVTAWVKADRPGIQLAAQVILPRTLDPRTGRPVSTILRGSTFSLPGQWQQLRIESLPRLMTRQTWLLRSQLGPDVDAREAYVERVLLNVYGGPGITNVWIDDLDIAGYVPVSSRSIDRSASAPAPDGGNVAQPRGGEAQSMGGTTAGGPPGSGRVSMESGVLRVDGRPFFPRAIRYQGEPLTLLKQLGFNAVWFARLPTPEILEEAARLELWLISPPPNPLAPAANAGPAPPPPEIGPGYRSVLAWDLGSGFGRQQFDSVSQWAKQIRTADRRNASRLLVCRPASELREYNRSDVADVLVVGRAPLGSSLELSEYGRWLREQPRLLSLGAPFWTTVETQPAESLRQQWIALSRDAPPSTFSSEQIRLLTYTAMTTGCRGLLFESFSPLSATDADTRMRALTLELLNLEMGMVEPWLTVGTVIATAPGNTIETVIAPPPAKKTGPGNHHSPEKSAAALAGMPAGQTAMPGAAATALLCEFGRLLVPVWSPPGAQFVSGQAAGHRMAFVIPGIPETNTPHLILPDGLPPLDGPRVAGGVRVTLDEFDVTALVLLTEKVHIFTEINRRAVQTGRRAAELQHELAAMKLDAVRRVSSRLPRSAAPRQAGQWLDAAQKDLAECSAYLASQNDRSAYLLAQRAMRPLRLLERAYWDAAVARFRPPVASPAAVCFATLPSHWALMERIAASQPAQTQLPGGEFEDIAIFFQSGWRAFQHRMAGVQAAWGLTPAAAHSGHLGVLLKAEPADPAAAPLWVESPPVWLNSPPVPVEAGQLIRIQGWVLIRKPITGSVDGLLVSDSLGGECLAARIQHTKGWEPFTLYRIAPQSGAMTLTIALSGFGEACIDDVTVQPLLPMRNGLQAAFGR